MQKQWWIVDECQHVAVSQMRTWVHCLREYARWKRWVEVKKLFCSCINPTYDSQYEIVQAFLMEFKCKVKYGWKKDVTTWITSDECQKTASPSFFWRSNTSWPARAPVIDGKNCWNICTAAKVFRKLKYLSFILKAWEVRSAWTWEIGESCFLLSSGAWINVECNRKEELFYSNLEKLPLIGKKT